MEPQASQSQDCEATPPLQRHNSNFYLPPMDGGGDSPRHNMRMYHARHSPHARQRYVHAYLVWIDSNLIFFLFLQRTWSIQRIQFRCSITRPTTNNCSTKSNPRAGTITTNVGNTDYAATNQSTGRSDTVSNVKSSKTVSLWFRNAVTLLCLNIL